MHWFLWLVPLWAKGRRPETWLGKGEPVLWYGERVDEGSSRPFALMLAPRGSGEVSAKPNHSPADFRMLPNTWVTAKLPVLPTKELV